MFVLSTQDNALFRGIATVVTIALVLYAVGTAYVRTAEAVNITDVYDLLSTSATSTASSHTIEFVTPTGINSNETYTIVFPDSFTGTSTLTNTDVDVEIDTVDQTVVAGAPGAAEWGWSWNTSNTLTFTAGASESAGANATVTVQLGAVAAGGTDRIVNPPTQGSYEIQLQHLFHLESWLQVRL